MRKMAWKTPTRCAALAWLALFVCGAMLSGSFAQPQESPPGQEKKTSTLLLEKGAALLQSKDPVGALNIYLNGFHFHADDMGRQMEVHHYCAQLSEEFHQCVMYDSAGEQARLMGVEYVISERLFRTLPEEEKKLWHSHIYEVKSGQLAAPGVPGPAEHALMARLATTYGKIWHTWNPGQDRLPLGIPSLMMGFTADGQIRQDLLSGRDERLGVSTQENRHGRQDIPDHDPLPGANAWESGQTPALKREQVPVKGIGQAR